MEKKLKFTDKNGNVIIKNYNMLIKQIKKKKY